MAKITLQNTKEHDITLNLVALNGEIHSVTIPAARQDENDRNKLIPGEAEAEGELVAATRKKSAVVEHYFEEGFLREKKAAKTSSKQEAKTDAAPAAGAAPWNAGAKQ